MKLLASLLMLFSKVSLCERVAKRRREGVRDGRAEIAQILGTRNAELYLYKSKNVTSRPMVMCGIPKVGITNMESAGFEKVAADAAAAALADPRTLRLVLVRDPLDRFASFYRNKIQQYKTSEGKNLPPNWGVVRQYNSLLLGSQGDMEQRPPGVYAAALAAKAEKGEGLERHLESMAWMCALDVLRYDVVREL